MCSIMYTVTSELYAEKNYMTNAKPSQDKTNVVSEFSFHFPPKNSKADEDGDLIIERKPKSNRFNQVIEIEHSANTVLDLVGLQVWRGALLLADWLLHNCDTLPAGKKVLELGSGVGLTSIVASMYSPVVCTDINKGGILELIQGNVKRNKKHTKNSVEVTGLDFMQPLSDKLKKELPNIATILAADVIYDDDVTEAFVDTMIRLFEDGISRSAYIALEKRYVFTLDDLNSVAPCYEHFLRCHSKLKKITGIKIEELSIDFPQYFQYEKVKQLVLWKIST